LKYITAWLEFSGAVFINDDGGHDR